MDRPLAETITTAVWRSALTAPERLLVASAASKEGFAPRPAGHVEIRAEVVETLLLRRRDDWPIDRRGLRVSDAHITGQLDLDHSDIAVPLVLNSCTFDRAPTLRSTHLPALDLRGSTMPGIVADEVRVDGNVHLSEGFVCTGTASLVGAEIGGEFDCRGGQFGGDKAAVALRADRIHVGAEVWLEAGFQSTGHVRFAAASIRRTLSFDGGKLVHHHDPTIEEDLRAAFHGNGMTVGGVWVLEGSTIIGDLSVRGASVRYLNDKGFSWPPAWLAEGFEFDDFVDDCDVDPKHRIEWLESRGHSQANPFWPPHYTGLAEVYQRRGDSKAARQVLIAREQRRTANAKLRDRPLRLFWGAVSEYGYRPQRAVWGLILLVALAGLGFARTKMQAIPESPPRFWSALYAADLALPLIDLRQANNFQPVTALGQALMWITTFAGWFLSGAFVAAVTGIFESDD